MRTIYFLCILSLFVSCNSCKTNSTTKQISEMEQPTILIDLKENVTPNEITKTFEEYNLVAEKEVSKALNIHLFSFNNSKIKVDPLLDIIKQSDLVENAQLNKKVTQRN